MSSEFLACQAHVSRIRSGFAARCTSRSSALQNRSRSSPAAGTTGSIRNTSPNASQYTEPTSGPPPSLPPCSGVHVGWRSVHLQRPGASSETCMSSNFAVQSEDDRDELFGVVVQPDVSYRPCALVPARERELDVAVEL